jgi:hypothetical protein
MDYAMSYRLLSICGFLLLLAFARDALACACCTNIGQRNVGSSQLDSSKFAQISELRFAAKARLFVGEAGPEDIRGISTPAESYNLTAAWQNSRLVLSFRDEAGRAGMLAIPHPSTVSVFEVDPRGDAHEGGTGPSLYKEWKLTGKPTGTGIFTAGLGPSQLLTLIFQGRGNSCTSSVDFTHWTLVMQGPKANYSLFGDLVTTP